MAESEILRKYIDEQMSTQDRFKQAEAYREKSEAESQQARDARLFSEMRSDEGDQIYDASPFTKSDVQLAESDPYAAKARRQEDLQWGMEKGNLVGRLSPGMSQMAEPMYRRGLRTGDMGEYLSFVGQMDVGGMIGGPDLALGLGLGKTFRAMNKFWGDELGHAVNPALMLSPEHLRDVARMSLRKSPDIPEGAVVDTLRNRAKDGEMGEFMRREAELMNDESFMRTLKEFTEEYQQLASRPGDRAAIASMDAKRLGNPELTPQEVSRPVYEGGPKPRYSVEPEPLTPRQGTTADPEPFDTQSRLLGEDVAGEANTTSAGNVQAVKEALDRRLIDRDPGSDAAFREFDYEADQKGMLFSDYEENLDYAGKAAKERLDSLRALDRSELTPEELALLKEADTAKKSRAQLAEEHQAYQEKQRRLAADRTRKGTQFLAERADVQTTPPVVTPAPGGAVREVYSADPTREQTERITDLLLRRGQYEGEGRPIERFASSGEAQGLDAERLTAEAADARLPAPKLPRSDVPSAPKAEPNRHPMADPKEEFGKRTGEYYRYLRDPSSSPFYGRLRPDAEIPPTPTRVEQSDDLAAAFPLDDERPFILGTSNVEVKNVIPKLYVEEGPGSSYLHRAARGLEDPNDILLEPTRSKWAPTKGRDMLSPDQYDRYAREVLKPYPRGPATPELKVAQDAWMANMTKLLRDPMVRPPPVVDGKYTVFYGHKNLPEEVTYLGSGRGQRVDRPERVAHALGTRQMEWVTEAARLDIDEAVEAGVIKTQGDFDNYVTAYVHSLKDHVQFWNPQQLHNYRVAAKRLADAKRTGRVTVGPERYTPMRGAPYGPSEVSKGDLYAGIQDRYLRSYDQLSRDLSDEGFKGHGPSREDLRFFDEPRRTTLDLYHDKSRPFERPTRVSPVREDGNRVIKSWLLQGPSKTGRYTDRPRLYGYDKDPDTGKLYRGERHTYTEPQTGTSAVKPERISRKPYDPRMEWRDLEFDVIKIKNQINDHKNAQLTAMRDILVDEIRPGLPSAPIKKAPEVDVTEARGPDLDLDPNLPWPKATAPSWTLYEDLPLKKVISGGQIGVDQAGLWVGETYGLQTGGTAPKGFRTAKGEQPGLQRLGLVEDASSNYKARTEKNVVDSDATVVFGNPKSPGSLYTISMAKRHRKPVFVVQWSGKGYPSQPPKSFREWLIENNVSTLNFAGNRETVNRGVGKKAATWFRDAIAEKSK